MIELAAPIAFVCVAALAWDLGRKHLADRKQAYAARLSGLLHEIDRERAERKQQAADMRSTLNMQIGSLNEVVSKNFLVTAEEIGQIGSDVNELRERPTEPPDVTALTQRQGVLEAAIKNLGIEARSELAMRVTKSELEGELKNVRTTQAGMLALGGRRR